MTITPDAHVFGGGGINGTADTTSPGTAACAGEHQNLSGALNVNATFKTVLPNPIATIGGTWSAGDCTSGSISGSAYGAVAVLSISSSCGDGDAVAVFTATTDSDAVGPCQPAVGWASQIADDAQHNQGAVAGDVESQDVCLHKAGFVGAFVSSHS